MTNVVEITEKNLDIVKQFKRWAEDFADGMIIAGSMAWGAYYALRDDSDIDLIIITDELKKIKSIIEKYIAHGLIEKNESQKFKMFETLYREGKCDEYSLVCHFEDTKVSIDFILRDTLEKICSFRELERETYKDGNDDIKIRVIGELSSKIPRERGYDLDNMKEDRKIAFHPKFQEIKDQENNLNCNIRQALVDGQIVNDKNKTYFLGIKTAFFAINPIIIIDKNGLLQKQCTLLRKNISVVLNNQRPVYITRQERMSQDMLKKIQDSFIWPDLDK